MTKQQMNSQRRLDLADAWDRWENLNDFELLEEIKKLAPERAIPAKRDRLLKILNSIYVYRFEF